MGELKQVKEEWGPQIHSPPTVTPTALVTPFNDTNTDHPTTTPPSVAQSVARFDFSSLSPQQSETQPFSLLLLRQWILREAAQSSITSFALQKILSSAYSSPLLFLSVPWFIRWLLITIYPPVTLSCSFELLLIWFDETMPSLFSVPAFWLSSKSLCLICLLFFPHLFQCCVILCSIDAIFSG